MKRSLLVICLVLTAMLFAGCSAEEETVYILASLPNDGGEMNVGTGLVIEEMNRALEPYNARVEYVSCDDYSVVAESILSGTAHIGTPSGATFTKTHLENNNVIPLFARAPEEGLEYGGYTAYIGTHIDNASDFEGMTEEERIQSLAGKTFSFVSATSTSGRLVPTTTLFETFGPDGLGLITERNEVYEVTAEDGGLFEEVQFGGNHPGSVQLIVEKKVYAGAFCCEYASEYEDDLYIITQKTVPPGPYWVNSENMEQEHIDALVDHFTALTPETAVEGFFSDEAVESDEGALFMNERYFAVDDSFYDFLKDMYAGEM